MFFRGKNEKIIFWTAIAWHAFLFLLIYFKLGWTGFYWGDVPGYVQIAKNLLLGNGFSMADVAPFVPDGFRTLMYPVFVAGVLFIFKNLYFISLVQILFFAIFALIIYRLGKEILSSKVAFISSLILILEPSMAYWNIMWLTETLFLFLLILGLYFFIEFYKKGSFLNIFFSASFLGLATLTRPAAQGLWFIFLILILFKKIGAKRCLISLIIFVAAFGITVAPWLIRNKFYFNTFSFSSADTSVFYQFNLPAYLKLNHLENIETESDYLYGLNKDSLSPNVSANDLNNHPYFMKKWLRLISADPFGYAKVHLFSLIPYFLGDGYTEIARQIFPDLYRPININWDGTLQGLYPFLFDHKGFEALIFWFGKIFWGCIYVFAVLGAIGLLKQRKYFYLILFLGIIFYFALTIGAVAYSRYRFPVNPLIFIFAAAGILSLIDKFRKYYVAKRI